MQDKDIIYEQERLSEKYQSEIYIKTYYTSLLAYEGYKKEVLNFLPQMRSEQRLLDIGCGTGWFLTKVANTYDVNRYGLDISAEMLAIARDKNANVTFFETPIEEFITTEKFDVITCLATLHHMPDLSTVAAKIVNLLEANGELIVHEPNKNWFYENNAFIRTFTRICYAPLRILNHNKVMELRRPWKNIPESPHHEDIDVPELIECMERAGLKLIEVKYKNTLMRVFEGMLFRGSVLDQFIYKMIRSADVLILDKISHRKAGAALLRFKKI